MRTVELSDNLPTSVGMYRMKKRNWDMCYKSPHKRGDVPKYPSLGLRSHEISPQAWGCTVRLLNVACHIINLPTSVGMYRRSANSMCSGSQSPHKRGDVPMPREISFTVTAISPQAWGCTDVRNYFALQAVNLPTSVGMYRPYMWCHLRGI